MQQSFKRNALLPVLFLACAVIFGFNATLQFMTGNSLAFFTIIVGGLMLLNAIWSFSTPLVIVDDKVIELKESLFKQRTISIHEIEQIDFSNEKYIEMHKKDKSSVKLRYSAMSGNDRIDFEKTMKQFLNKSTI